MAQRVVDETSSPDTVEETSPESAEGQETQKFFESFALGRATKDEDSPLSRDDIMTIEKKEEETEETDYVARTGGRLAEMGDLIDHYTLMEIRDYADAITNKKTFQEALQQFKSLVKYMFEGPDGQTVITAGRVLILMVLCYEVCMSFVRRNMGGSFLSIIGIVGTWLWTAFLKYGINQWLQRQGGWGKLVATASESILSWPWGKHTLLVIGLVSLTVWAVAYFRSY